MAHQTRKAVLRVIDRCPKGKAKAQRARFGFSLKAHQWRKGAAVTHNPARCRFWPYGLVLLSDDSGSRRHQSGARAEGLNGQGFHANMARSYLTVGCSMPRTPGSGNALWQAVAVGHRFKLGRPGFRKCAALKRNGQPCGNLAMRHVSVCQCHGGRMLVARLRLRQKVHRHRFSFS